MKAFIHANIKNRGVAQCNGIPFFIVVTVRFCIKKLQSIAGNSSFYVGKSLLHIRL